MSPVDIKCRQSYRQIHDSRRRLTPNVSTAGMCVDMYANQISHLFTYQPATSSNYGSNATFALYEAQMSGLQTGDITSCTIKLLIHADR